MKFNFKSVGKKVTDRKYKTTKEKVESKLVPIGIKTPLRFGKGQNELFDCHLNAMDQIRDNLKNLVLTQRGERLGRYNLGVDLNSFSFEYAFQKDFETLIAEQITNQINLHIPAITVENVRINNVSKQSTLNSDESLAIVKIEIIFSVAVLKRRSQKLSVNLQVGG
tara:strand:- start:290 stop:787 length:498 start_codon:yes stop_codon:yes gene_type:complete